MVNVYRVKPIVDHYDPLTPEEEREIMIAEYDRVRQERFFALLRKMAEWLR